VLVFLAVDGAGLGAMLCGGTMAAASVVNCLLLLREQNLECSNHVGVTNVGGGIDVRIPPHIIICSLVDLHCKPFCPGNRTGYKGARAHCTRLMLLSHCRVDAFLELTSLEPATLSV
jgi:hypothetical protein